MMNESQKISSCFFTVTLSRELLAKPIKSQLLKTYRVINRICHMSFIKFEYCYELTQNGNIHYHGIGKVAIGDEHIFLHFQDLLKCKVFGFNKVDTIKKDNGTAEYIIKSIDVTERLMKRLKIDLNIYPIICTETSKLKAERFIVKPLANISTINLDVLESISEFAAVEEREAEEEEYLEYLYNYNNK